MAQKRVTIAVAPLAADALTNLAKDGFFGNTISGVAHTLLMQGMQANVERGHINVPGAFQALLPTGKSRLRTRAAGVNSILRNRTQIILQSRAIILALGEVLAYEPKRHHNLTTPELWIDDPAYIKQIKELVAELKRLNDILESVRPNPRQAKRSTIHLAKHFDTFLHHAAAVTGKGAGALLVAAMGSLLYQAGIGKELVDSVCGHLKWPK